MAQGATCNELLGFTALGQNALLSSGFSTIALTNLKMKDKFSSSKAKTLHSSLQN